MNQCSQNILPKSFECDYIPPLIKTITARKLKSGQWQVKLNGKGKWINAIFNSENNTLEFTA